jgi:competence ComEA-like helix-hairpin-helix protein
VKQKFSTARSPSQRIRVLVFVLATTAQLSAACATLPQNRYLTQTSFQESSTGKVSRININDATAPDLEKLPGVGKVIAERIVEHRTQYGAFRRPEHLMMVRGISDQKFRALRELIRTE